MVTLDSSLFVAAGLAAPTGVAEFVLLPMDLVAIWVTWKFPDLAQQAASKPCTDIRFTFP